MFLIIFLLFIYFLKVYEFNFTASLVISSYAYIVGYVLSCYGCNTNCLLSRKKSIYSVYGHEGRTKYLTVEPKKKKILFHSPTLFQT